MPDSGIQSFDPSDYFILIVDDLPKNLQLVGTVLRNNGYRVSPAGSGQAALERLQNVKADLILLDLMMPEMDGLEVCEKLKENPDTADIPVIFLTASSELEHLLTAFELGAMDYITKPFYAPELLARVKTQIELKYSREALLQANTRLKELNNEKNEFMGIASHDLKSPLTSILGISQLIQASPDMSHEDIMKWVGKVEDQSQRMVYIIKNLLDANRLDRGEMRMNISIVSINSMVDEVISQLESSALNKEQELEFECGAGQLPIRVDQNLMLQVLENLISNAIKYSPPGKTILIKTYSDLGKVIMEVSDEGPGLSREDQAQLFKRFARLTPEPTGGEHSSGLGLSIVKRLVEGMGGEVWFRSELGKGSTFGVTFKLIEQGAEANPLI
ncbi:MAG: hybrid sensor histidine kinase/response regulator [Verrucomicrobiota bacterium]